MPIQPNMATIKYLQILKPPKPVLSWLTGYDEDGFWDPRRILIRNNDDPTRGEAMNPIKRKPTRKRKATEQSNYNSIPYPHLREIVINPVIFIPFR
jgi:hypothetical protein